MGDEDERRPDLAVDPRQLGLHVLAELEVERAERLVEQEHRRSLGEGAGEGHPLLLAAGHLGRAAAGSRPARPTSSRYSPVRRVTSADGQLLHPQPERDVLGDGHVREQGVVLEDRVDVALVGRQVVDGPALDEQLARAHRDEPADEVEGRRLAAAGRPEEAEELARLDHHRHVVQGDRVPVAFRRMAQLDGGYRLRQGRDHSMARVTIPRAAGSVGAAWGSRSSVGITMIVRQGCGTRASVPYLCNRLYDASVRPMARQYSAWLRLLNLP